MKELYCVHFNKAAKLADLYFPKNSIVMLSSGLCKKALQQGFGQVYKFNDVFKNFNVNDNTGVKILFTHLGGGIGDIIAYSAVAKYLEKHKIIVYSDPNLHQVLGMYAKPVEKKHSYEPIFNDYSLKNRMSKYKNYERLKTEYAAVEARDKNWYIAFFENIGLADPPVEFLRPHLKYDGIKSEPKTVLICHRSSCQMRSSTFQDFYEPVRDILPGYQVFVHLRDLTDDDKLYIGYNALPVRILPECSIKEYLENVSRASMVVCTDTSAIHYREAMRKPGLGVFGAMTVESRVKYYKYTKSFNVPSDCPYQPCFIHELNKGDHCTIWNERKKHDPGYFSQVAECQTGELFRDQLAVALYHFMEEC